MTGRQLASALRAGQRVYGTLIIAPSPHWVAAVKSTGLDFVFIDTEHIPLGRETLAWMCQAYRALGLPPVVRIPSPDPYQATVALDGGACGVLAPYVETPEQVRALVGAVKLRPLKGARLAETLNGQALEEPLATYVRERNADNLVFINIESAPALERLDELLRVPGIDAVQVGPHDLSCSLGVPEDYAHPRFEEAVHTIIRAARAHGLGVGVHYWGAVEDEIRWAQAGANLIVHSGDISLFATTLRADLHRFRTALGDDAAQSNEQIII